MTDLDKQHDWRVLPPEEELPLLRQRVVDLRKASDGWQNAALLAQRREESVRAQLEAAREEVAEVRRVANAAKELVVINREERDAAQARVRVLEEELTNIAQARRFDRMYFDDDTAFADWAQSRARWTLGKADAALAPVHLQSPFIGCAAPAEKPEGGES
jgi:ABC-type Na+ efflux pump permease subunit